MQALITILLADTLFAHTDILSDHIKNDKSFHCKQYKTEKELFAILQNVSPQVLIYELTWPEAEDNFAILRKIHTDYPYLLIITIIPDGAEELIESVLQLDVFFYIHKPYDPAEINIAFKRTRSKINSRSSATIIPSQEILPSFYGMIGQSQQMRQLFELVAKVADDEFATVLIRGESGTGKELVAKAIHTHSKRKNKNFVPVNCAAIPDDLLESELFGYTKGAFTGALQNKKGRIEYADGGTLFLDEIGDMKPSLQAKLLRVLQEKEFEPVGGLKACPVDTRIVAATHCDLEKLVSEGRFREDLYYRLSVIPLNIPSLKERREDIPLLLEAFIQTYSTKRGREPLTLGPQVITALMNYEWRGNVRELENLVQHMSILFCGKNVDLQDLPEKFTVDFDPLTPAYLPSSPVITEQTEPIEEEPEDIVTAMTDISWKSGQVDFNELINDFERQLIIQAMKITGGNKKEAARLLNLKRTTLLEKMKKKEMQDIWEE